MKLSSLVPSRSAAAAGSVAVVSLAALSGCLGSTSTSTTTVAAQPVVVQVASPSNGAVINASSVAIRGTVSPTNAVVQIAGQPAAVGNGVFTGSASLQQGKNTIDVIASAPGRSPGSTTLVITRPGAGASGSSGSPSPAPSQTGGQSSCGGGLSVGPATSCAFAQNVQAAYSGNGGPGTFAVYSPVTGQTYTMTCNLSGSEVTCTGGNNASVFFPQPSSGQSGSQTSGQSSCGGGLSVGPNTSCAFAENVEAAYRANGGPGTFQVNSPTTGQTYSMTCNTSGGQVVCTGGNDASVYFPQ